MVCILWMLLCAHVLGCGTDASEPDATPLSPYEKVHFEVLRTCTGGVCHDRIDPGGELSLTKEDAYDALVGAPSVQRTDMLLVDPGSPDTSYLLIKLGVGDLSLLEEALMPSGEPLLPQSDLDLIIQWIEDGAPR